MSDRFSASRNSSPYFNSPFNNSGLNGPHGSHGPWSPRSPIQRYGAGIAMVVLVHAGAIVAIKSGLDISGIVPDIPPIIAKAMPVSPPVQKPVDAKPELTEFTLANPQEPTLQYVEPETVLPPVERVPGPTTGTGDTVKANPVATIARSDPRHPLTQPGYPPQSRRLGEEGSVQLLVFVLANGRVGEAQIAISSGFPRLDEAAMREALRSWRFLPNTVDGVATAGWSRIGVTFRLKN